MKPLLVFTLDDWRCALHLATVETAYRAVAITPLPSAPDIVLGIVNVRGTVLPIIDLRKCFGLPAKPLSPAHHIIVGHTARRPVALLVDTLEGVVECAEQKIAAADGIVPGMGYVEGVALLDGGMILINDLDNLLSLEQEFMLDGAMAEVAP